MPRHLVGTGIAVRRHRPLLLGVVVVSVLVTAAATVALLSRE